MAALLPTAPSRARERFYPKGAIVELATNEKCQTNSKAHKIAGRRLRCPRTRIVRLCVPRVASRHHNQTPRLAGRFWVAHLRQPIQIDSPCCPGAPRQGDSL